MDEFSSIMDKAASAYVKKITARQLVIKRYLVMFTLLKRWKRLRTRRRRAKRFLDRLELEGKETTHLQARIASLSVQVKAARRL